MYHTNSNCGQPALYCFAYVSTQNELFFRSNSSLNRENSPAFVWVDYTKV